MTSLLDEAPLGGSALTLSRRAQVRRMRKLIVPPRSSCVAVAAPHRIGARRCGRWAIQPASRRVVKTSRTRRLLEQDAFWSRNRRGLTLYHLSVERKGHFICTNSACSRAVAPTRRGHGSDTDRRQVARHRRSGPTAWSQVAYRAARIVRAGRAQDEEARRAAVKGRNGWSRRCPAAGASPTGRPASVRRQLRGYRSSGRSGAAA
mgnify:CR=1 FL=1